MYITDSWPLEKLPPLQDPLLRVRVDGLETCPVIWQGTATELLDAVKGLAGLAGYGKAEQEARAAKLLETGGVSIGAFVCLTVAAIVYKTA